MKDTPRIIIEVRGGMVTQVYSDVLISVSVLDYDDFSIESDNRQREVLLLEAETKNMYTSF